METRLIQIILPRALVERACEGLGEIDPANWWRMPLSDDEDAREQVFVIAKPGRAQEIMDSVSNVLEGEDGWRQVLLPVEAVAPKIQSEEEEAELRSRSVSAARDEIVEQVRQDATLSPDFLIMVALSTVVAAIGLNADQVAAVIGAMVIAPLLGPIMGVALGVALGARSLLVLATVSTLAGFGTCALVSAAMALILPVNMDSGLLDYAQPVQLGTMALALASGAAAAMATSTGRSSPLVGVMVAAAVLPPVVAAGLLLAGGAGLQAARAGFIVLVNLACITLAAQLVFMARGIRPRGWSELKAAETSRLVNLVGLGALLVVMAAIILFWDVI